MIFCPIGGINQHIFRNKFFIFLEKFRDDWEFPARD